MMTTIELRAWAEPYWRHVTLAMVQRGPAGDFVGEPVVMRKVNDLDNSVPPPLLQLRPEQAQLLMDDLWRCGLRPSEGSGSAGALAATQAHLKDMQTLTFKLIERTSPDNRTGIVGGSGA